MRKWLLDPGVIVFDITQAPRRYRWAAVDVNGDDYCFSVPAVFDRFALNNIVVLVAWPAARTFAAVAYPPDHPPGVGLHSPRSLREP